MEKYFLTQIKHTNGVWEKGCVVKDTLEEVKQSYHAYLGAWAYGHDAKTDYVQCIVTDINGMVNLAETWNGIQEEPNDVQEEPNDE